jgi:Tfp pilus assembly protein PilZ
MADPQALLREYAALDQRRQGDGVTPLEYQRWLDLRARLARAFPGRPPPGGAGPVVLCVEFATRARLAASVMMNLRPVGLFVNTPFAAERGARFSLRVRLVETGEEFTSPVVVVSNNVGPDFSTAKLGMGLRFAEASCPLRDALERLCAPPGVQPRRSRETIA